MLVDGVDDFNQSMIAPQPLDTARVAGKLTATIYKREAVAAVAKLTRQRVASFVSSHDRDTDVATEIFTLEPSFGTRLAACRAAVGKRLHAAAAGLKEALRWIPAQIRSLACSGSSRRRPDSPATVIGSTGQRPTVGD